MRTKVLITSVGSLVGQNILDAIEYPEFSRRELLDIVGINSIAESPNNFRCDSCYIVPITCTFEFTIEITKIIEKEKPDIILTGRDEDSSVLRTILDDHPEWNIVLPYGSKKSMIYALDKWETWQLCQKYNLPFAKTFVLNKSGDIDEFKKFINDVGYPMIGKPIRGFASKGVFYIRTFEEAMKIVQYDHYMIQEYLGDASLLVDYFEKMDGPTPLFAHAPNIFHNAYYTVIDKDGSKSTPFISKNQHDSGKTVGYQRVMIPELEEIGNRFADALYLEGGMGPLNIQFRQCANGEWKVQEINMRTNGNTFSRLILGQDELGLMFEYFLPEANIPVLKNAIGNEGDYISKILYCNRIEKEKEEALNNNGYWSMNS